MIQINDDTEGTSLARFSLYDAGIVLFGSFKPSSHRL